ncbi:transcription termination factor Rho [Micromonospora sp. NBC_01813]|uniref:transcription termination factor Rho n=1 Tax=Micromonospora sp. NBC_01813 TaxID=2975988 RepID=UPI002DD9B065|nr:transcription termination factor Rho [Micromonospora sp. NBC_01813]WSA08810.1 transcription termination factor Rho [Micromonospora sp. NBC_01813]
MSDTTDMTSDVSNVADDTTAAPARRRRSGTGLSAMLLPELQSLAASLGISGTARMRKSELIVSITERQAGGGAPRPRAEVAAATAPPREEVRAEVRTEPERRDGGAERRDGEQLAIVDEPAARERPTRRGRSSRAALESPVGDAETATTTTESGERGDGRGERPTEGRSGDGRNAEGRSGGDGRGSEGRNAEGRNGRDRGERADRGDRNNDRGDRSERGDRNNDRNDRNDRNNDRGPRDSRDSDDGDDDGSGRRGRRSRFRDRRRRGDRGDGAETGGGSGGGGGREPQVSEDDVLVPVAGILDVLDNYAFVRTTGYLAGPNDVYVSMSQVKKHGLRRGDAVTGAVRASREGEQRRDKYNPLVRLDTINGMEPDEARQRPEFYKLTPLYPQDRLRLETEPHILTTRVIDLVMPIGKGQRALIVSPPKAGKTMVLQAIANAITQNNPECHLMVVLVDERPEEVTDMQRSVKGEVVAATFDRPPQDHTTVAELAIERAKRLVELGHDVVVLLDSVTRLGRSYNLAAPASGRIMSGGIDSTALYPPKRFLGAARNIENGGSLTILATALVETGSMMDTVIFEEFKGTGNAELKLDRKIADKRVFPAIDIHPSGTRKEEILLAPEELAITHKLRKVLHSLDSQGGLDLLLDRLKQSRTNIEFLMQIAKSTPGE